jgi:hypothetical protein
MAEQEQKQKEAEANGQSKVGEKVKLNASEYVTSGYLKNRLIKILVNLTKKHQKNRSEITDEQVRLFMRQRPLQVKRTEK